MAGFLRPQGFLQIKTSLDWVMITLEDCTDKSVKDVEGDEDDSFFLLYPVGIVEVVVLAAIVVAIRREELE